jgi:ABC-type nickel/cobalt efflux system permease component RcnA
MDSSIATTLLFGFLLGIEHALEADHVVAVSTMVSQTRSLSRASLTGISWGMGHTLTLLVAGLVVLFLKVNMPEGVALSLEFVVGVVLVSLGGEILWGYCRKKVHAHPHRHGESVHDHFHSHAQSDDHAHDHHPPSPGKACLVGMIHGLAGSAALMLVVLTTVRTPVQGMCYLLIFGLGSIVGMLMMSSLVALPFALTAVRFQRINEAVRMAAGLTSIALGGSIMLRIGSAQGLFGF